jgi:hypothetical protein
LLALVFVVPATAASPGPPPEPDTPPGDPPIGAQEPVEGGALYQTGHDSFVRVQGAARTASSRPPALGYALTFAGVGLHPAYVVRMVDDQPWDAVDDVVAQAMAEAQYVTGVHFTWGAPAPSHDATGFREIGVSVTSTSPCGPMSNPGTIGCGGYFTDLVWVQGAAVYICGCILGDPELLRSTVLHEFGHAIGLDHYWTEYHGRYQVMSYSATDATRYRTGDVNGLRRMVANAGRTAPHHPPSAAADVRVSNGGFGRIEVAWGGAAAYGRSIDHHEIEVQNLSSGGIRRVTVGAARSATVSIGGGTEYRTRVRAHNAVGWGSWSGWSGGTYVTGPCRDDITDVGENDAFCDPITWLVDEEIATGYRGGTFRPRHDVTRDAMAAFLFRDAERLVPGSTDGNWSSRQTFDDVPRDHPFHDEIEWLAATGITSGYDDGGFRPGRSVDRQAMAAFLMRFTEHLDPGSTEGDWSDSPFDDVRRKHPFHDEITWIESTGISTGNADGTFAPGADVSRQAMAAFLHRHDEEFG